MTPDNILGDFTAHMADAVMVTFKPDDGDPYVVHVNQSFEELLGWTLQEVTGPEAGRLAGYQGCLLYTSPSPRDS